MENNILVHNKATDTHTDFLAIPIYSFKFALDSIRAVDTIKHREGLRNESMGYISKIGDTEYIFTELGDLNNYKSVKF